MRSALIVVLLSAALGANASADEDPEAWLSARGVKDPAGQLGDPCCCVEIIVGGAAEHALHCREATPIDGEGADIAVSEVIRVVRGGKAVKVLEAWTAIENLDLPRGSRPVLALRLTIAPGARTATIVDPGDSRNRCGDLPGGGGRRWMDRICRSRGTYRWRGGRFVRAAR